jgi:uncharacterized repeat protein (TIGR03803 family)
MLSTVLVVKKEVPVMNKTGLCTIFATTFLALAVVAVQANAQVFSPLYSFNNSPGSTDPLDFVFPGIVTQGLDGNIYGTSLNGGGPPNTGAFFNMSPASGGPSVLYSFNGASGCSGPAGGLTLGTDGNFHSTLSSCTDGNGAGEVISLTSGGGLTMLYSFMGGSDGGDPWTAPVEAMNGNYYGTTISDGGPASCGTIYQIAPDGVLTVLHAFGGAPDDGCGSYGALALGTDGNLYGTTISGGTQNFGTVFQVTTGGGYKLIYNFDGSHGTSPTGSLVQDSNGDFYGTAQGGGVGANAFGVVFKISTAGKIKVLHTFNPTTQDGAGPVAGLALANNGDFYGVTEQGGASTNCTLGCGTIFSINAAGTSYSKLHDFVGTDGELPEIALVQRTNGTLYGFTFGGGTYNAGVFFSFDDNLAPFAGLLPFYGSAGTMVGILGQGFTGTKKVIFAGEPATFTVVSDTYLTATVPSSAKTGLVTVKTPTGSLKSNRKFIVNQ